MAMSMTGISVPIKANDISIQPIIPNVQRIENATTKKGRNTPDQLRKEIIRRRTAKPRAKGVKTRMSRCIFSITVALVMGKLET